MKMLHIFVVFAVCTFAKGAKALGLDYTQMNDIYLRSQEIHTSLEKSIYIAKSMIQSMETKLSEAHKYVGMLEDKLKVCGQNNMLSEQLEKKPTPSDDASKEYILNIVEDRIIKLKHEQIRHSENVTKMLVRMENRLSNIDVLEAKLHKAESAISRVEAELEKNINVLEYKHKPESAILKVETELEKNMKENIPVAIKPKSSSNDIQQNTSASDVLKSAITKANSDNDAIIDHWHDIVETETNLDYSAQSIYGTNRIFRGFRAAADDRVAFRVSGISRFDGHYIGERIVFASVDYNEGSGYDMNSGTFTCPTTGTYFFTATIGSIGKLYVDAFLKIDGVVKIRVYAGFHLQGDNMSTAVTIAHCRAGQSVWMEVSNGDHLGGWESMSGFLIWPEIARS
ncbi:hypothetical protein ACJMK2_022489 [Sinanodonta woodiana]|uniref:C1q domain-containing protein n=1 Tax=Sinanodonta woodiana TaxID=1069815 RepID=A0ABD3TLY8_SINWO